MVSQLVIALSSLWESYLTSNINFCINICLTSGACESVLDVMHTELQKGVALFHPCRVYVEQREVQLTLCFLEQPSLHFLQYLNAWCYRGGRMRKLHLCYTQPYKTTKGKRKKDR